MKKYNLSIYEKRSVIILNSFVAFNVNAVNNFIYMLTSNLSFFLIVGGVIGTIVLQLKEEVDISVREEQNII